MCVNIERYTPERQQAWDQFVLDSKQGTFLFLRPYMDYHSDRFHDFSLFITDDKGEIIALLPACCREDTIYSHAGLTYGGLITDKRLTAVSCMSCFEAINTFLRQNGFKRVIYKAIPFIYHTIPAEEDLYTLTHVCHATLTAREISSTIINGNALKWRRDRHYNSTRALRRGITVKRSVAEEDFAAFWSVLNTNLLSNHNVKPVHSLPELLLLHKRFPDNIVLFTAWCEEEIAAGTILFLTPQTVHAQYIASTQEGKKAGAVDALYNHVLREWLPTTNYKYFDFGKSTELSGTWLNHNLISQKEGFGARAVCYDTYTWTL